MHMRRYPWLMLLWIGVVLAACAGGSGSSGFDVRSENDAIQTALAEQRCVQHESLTICPASETRTPPAGSPSPSPGATATPASAQQIAVGVDPSTPLACTTSGRAGACGFTLPFSTAGFPHTASFRVAWRTVTPNASWTIGGALAPAGTATPYDFAAPVDVGAQFDGASGTITMQAAVLVFLNPAAASVPAVAAELVDTGADAAYVTGPFVLQPQAG